MGSELRETAAPGAGASERSFSASGPLGPGQVQCQSGGWENEQLGLPSGSPLSQHHAIRTLAPEVLRYSTPLRSIQKGFRNKIFLKCVIFLNLLSQALQQLRTSEFKPYVIFVKPAIQERRKTPPMSPACEDTASPLVSLKWIISQGLKGFMTAA